MKHLSREIPRRGLFIGGANERAESSFSREILRSLFVATVSRKHESFSSHCIDERERERKDNNHSFALSVVYKQFFDMLLLFLSLFFKRLHPQDTEGDLVHPGAFCGDILSYEIADIHRISIEMAADVAAAIGRALEISSGSFTCRSTLPLIRSRIIFSNS